MTAHAWTDERLELGEGIRWIDERLALVDILRGRLLEHDGTGPGPLRQLAQLDVPLGAVAPVDGAPGWIVAAGTGIALLDEHGGLEWIARPEDGNDGRTRMNDAVCDPAGRFWAGSMAYDGETPLGSLYRVDQGGAVTRVLDGVAIANGPAFSRDGRTMAFADSGRRTVTRFDVDPETGALGGGEQIVALAAQEGTPDGMLVDDEGFLWVAVWGGSCVRRYTLEGELVVELPIPARQVTSVAIARGMLFVTSAAVDLDDQADGRVYAIRLADQGIEASAGSAAAYRA